MKTVMDIEKKLREFNYSCLDLFKIHFITTDEVVASLRNRLNQFVIGAVNNFATTGDIKACLDLYWSNVEKLVKIFSRKEGLNWEEVIGDFEVERQTHFGEG